MARIRVIEGADGRADTYETWDITRLHCPDCGWQRIYRDDNKPYWYICLECGSSYVGDGLVSSGITSEGISRLAALRAHEAGESSPAPTATASNQPNTVAGIAQPVSCHTLIEQLRRQHDDRFAVVEVRQRRLYANLENNNTILRADHTKLLRRLEDLESRVDNIGMRADSFEGSLRGVSARLHKYDTRLDSCDRATGIVQLDQECLRATQKDHTIVIGGLLDHLKLP